MKEGSDHKVDPCRALQISDFIAFAGVLKAPENPSKIHSPCQPVELDAAVEKDNNFAGTCILTQCEAHEIKARSPE